MEIIKLLGHKSPSTGWFTNGMHTAYWTLTHRATRGQSTRGLVNSPKRLIENSQLKIAMDVICSNLHYWTIDIVIRVRVSVIFLFSVQYFRDVQKIAVGQLMWLTASWFVRKAEFFGFSTVRLVVSLRCVWKFCRKFNFIAVLNLDWFTNNYLICSYLLLFIGTIKPNNFKCFSLFDFNN